MEYDQTQVIEGKVGWGTCDVYEGIHHRALCDAYHHSIHGLAPEPNWKQLNEVQTVE